MTNIQQLALDLRARQVEFLKLPSSPGLTRADMEINMKKKKALRRIVNYAVSSEMLWDTPDNEEAPSKLEFVNFYIDHMFDFSYCDTAEFPDQIALMRVTFLNLIIYNAPRDVVAKAVIRLMSAQQAYFTQRIAKHLPSMYAHVRQAAQALQRGIYTVPMGVHTLPLGIQREVFGIRTLPLGIHTQQLTMHTLATLPHECIHGMPLEIRQVFDVCKAIMNMASYLRYVSGHPVDQAWILHSLKPVIRYLQTTPAHLQGTPRALLQARTTPFTWLLHTALDL